MWPPRRRRDRGRPPVVATRPRDQLLESSHSRDGAGVAVGEGDGAGVDGAGDGEGVGSGVPGSNTHANDIDGASKGPAAQPAVNTTTPVAGIVAVDEGSRLRVPLQPPPLNVAPPLSSRSAAPGAPPLSAAVSVSPGT